MEKGRQANNVIRKVKSGSKVAVNSDDTLDEIVKFYKKLYSSDDIPHKMVDEYFNCLENVPTLNEDERRLCDEAISECELKQAVLKIKNKRSPGLDGLTPEFYKYFYDDIKDLYMKMINETFVYGELPDTMREAILTLIYKKGDKDLLKNYRPISLTNYDYKIIAFILARRLQTVIKAIVNEDQSGYIKGRYIGYNIRMIEDLVDFTEYFNLMGCIICLDFEKAFDSVNWYFMFRTLEQFNFGDSFVKWIKILYNKPSICCKNNGWISESFKAERGIRQGCPVSALLFLLVVEIMAIQIRNNPHIKGFDIIGNNFKLTQYADDTTLLLSDLDSIEKAINVISVFSKVSGLNLNIAKCEGLWLGAADKNVQTFSGIHFVNEPIKCLGIYIGGCTKKRENLNWEKKLEKFDKLLERWKERKLTMFGKVVIIKSLAIAQLVFNFNLLPVSCDIVKRINKSIYSFMWNSKDRIRRNVLINKQDKGGIDMVDIDCKVNAIKAAWMSRIVTNPNAKWVSFFKYFLHHLDLKLEFLTYLQFRNIKLFPIIKCLPQFYLDMLTSFSQIKGATSGKLTDSEFLKSMIWGNEAFQQKGKCLFIRNLIKSGFIFVKDLFDEHGNFFTENAICNKLESKKNWMIEYLSVKKCIMSQAKNHDCNSSYYINKSKMCTNFYLQYDNRYHDIKDLNSKFYYHVLVRKKSVRNYTEKCWQKHFNIDIYASEWGQIYSYKVWQFPIKKIAEFNYKLIHKLIYGKYEISRWKKEVVPFCDHCGETDNMEHRIYGCIEVKSIWNRLGSLMHVNIAWKHVVLGFLIDGQCGTFRNTVVSIVAFSIYKSRILQELNNSTSQLIFLVRKEVIQVLNILQQVKFRGMKNTYSEVKKISDNL